MSKQINSLDARAAAELVALHNPIPNDSDIITQTLECLNLAPVNYFPPQPVRR